MSELYRSQITYKTLPDADISGYVFLKAEFSLNETKGETTIGELFEGFACTWTISGSPIRMRTTNTAKASLDKLYLGKSINISEQRPSTLSSNYCNTKRRIA